MYIKVINICIDHFTAALGPLLGWTIPELVGERAPGAVFVPHQKHIEQVAFILGTSPVIVHMYI